MPGTESSSAVRKSPPSPQAPDGQGEGWESPSRPGALPPSPHTAPAQLCNLSRVMAPEPQFCHLARGADNTTRSQMCPQCLGQRLACVRHSIKCLSNEWMGKSMF